MAVSPQEIGVKCTRDDIETMASSWKLQTDVDSPCGRYGHTLTFVNNRIYMFGGYSDIYHGELYVYNDAGKWILLGENITSPRPRFGHAAFEYDGSLYVFGGDSGYKSLNDVWKYDLFEGVWILLETTGQIPAPRSCMGSCVYQDKLVIFGGVDRYHQNASKFYDDVYVMDLKTNKWSYFDTKTQRRALERLERKDLDLTQDSSSSSSTSSTSSSSSSTSSSPSPNSSKKESENSISSSKKSAPIENEEFVSKRLSYHDLYDGKDSEEFPRPRKGQIMFCINDIIYVFGGIDRNGVVLGDLWSLDMKTSIWRSLKLQDEVKENIPSPRAYPGYCQFKDHFFLFGGMSGKEYLNDLWTFDSRFESFVHCNTNDCSCSRAGNSSRQSSRSERLGSSRQSQRDSGYQNAESSFYYRPTTARTREMKLINETLPIGRYGASLGIKNGKMIMFGGYSYLGLMNDTWEINISSSEEFSSQCKSDDLAHIPMTEDDINFELVLSGFRKFVEKKVKKLTEDFNEKNSKVEESVLEFRNILDNMLISLDEAEGTITNSVEQTNNSIKKLYNDFVKFIEDQERIAEESKVINEELKGEFKDLKIEAKDTLNKVKEFNEILKNVFEKLEDKNEKMVDKLNERDVMVTSWIAENYDALNDRINVFSERCNEYDKDISEATKKVEDINDQQTTFFTDVAHKINGLRNNMEDFKNSVVSDFGNLVQKNEDAINELNKETDDIDKALENKRSKNNETMDEIFGIVDNCISYIDVKFNDADSLNKDDEDAVNAKIQEYEDAIKNALNDNKEKNERYLGKATKKTEEKCEAFKKDLEEIKVKAQEMSSDLEQKQKRFTENIMSDINTIHANETQGMNSKCEAINEVINGLQLNATNLDQQVKSDSIEKINANKDDILKYCKEKIKSIFEKCDSSNNEMLEEEEEALLKIISDMENKVEHRNEKYDEFQNEIAEVKKMIDQLKDGHFDHFNEYNEDIDKLREKIEETNGVLVSRMAEDKKNEFAHRDSENKMEQKFSKYMKLLDEIAKSIEQYENTTNKCVENINENRKDLRELAKNQENRLADVERKINEEIEGGVSKYNNLISKVDAQKSKEKEDKEEMINRCNEVTNEIESIENRIANSKKEFKKAQSDISKKISEIRTKVLDSASICKSIDIPVERFEHAESSIQVVKEQNSTVKEKAEALNKKVEEYQTQMNEDTKKRKEEFVKNFDQKKGEIDKLVQERVYNKIEHNKSQCSERVEKAIENLDKCTEIIEGKETSLANQRREIGDIVEEMKRDVDFNVKVINDRRAQMGLSIDKVNKAIKEKRAEEHDLLKKYQGYLEKYDNKNRIDCEEVILSFDTMSNKIITMSQDCYQQYLSTISGLDMDFIRELPEKIKALETDATDLDAVVDEIRKQVRAHAKELTTIKASLRDIACISEKAYESSSKLIGRVKSESQPVSE